MNFEELLSSCWLGAWALPSYANAD